MRRDRVLADKCYTSKANRAWLAERGIKATIPENLNKQRTGIEKAPLAGARQRSTVRPTGRGATSSNGDSIDSRTGAALPCDRTKPHAATSPPSNSRTARLAKSQL